MSYPVILISLAILALIFLAVGVFILFRKGWFVAWLKGMAGVGCILLAAFLILSAFDLSSYRALTLEKPLATVSFERIGEQRFKAMVSIAEQENWNYELAGDMWQLDAKIIRWTGPVAAMGVLPGYRLDRISGRYLSIEQETGSERTAYELHHQIGLDLWSWVNSRPWLPILDATYGSATFLPMRHGALFSIQLTNNGLLARPINEPAQAAIQEWQF